MSVQPIEREQRVAPLELFFDLVFVFGFTQVTTVLSHDPTWRGLGHGLLLLCAFWWVWAAYAWLTNTIDTNDGRIGGSLFAAMAAMFIASLAAPEAFGRHGVIFGVAFLAVVVMQLTLYALPARGDRDLLRSVALVVPWTLAGALLIVAAGFLRTGIRPAVWAAALAIGLLGPILVQSTGWHLRPAHFVERHGLIVIIAIGESLVSIGLGARDTSLGLGVIVAAVLGLFVAASFWLAYFDFFTIRAQQLLDQRTGAAQIVFARDAFSYLHLPMVTGIVLFAFAVKTTLAHVDKSLSAVPALGLCGGSALYLLAYVALRVRISRTLGGGRLVAAIVCLALLPVALTVPAIAALSLIATVWAALHAYELIWWRNVRAETRAQRAL